MRHPLILLGLASAALSWAQGDIDEAIRKRNTDAATDSYNRNMKQYASLPDMLVLPGLLADRKTKRVTVWGEATGISGGTTAEFFLIGQSSGHSYEALAISFATPGDIQRALEFIGMKPGRSVDYAHLQFWPKGERVFMSMRPEHAAWTNGQMRVEDMMVDTRTGKPMSRGGLVFTGSPLVPADENSDTRIHAADKTEPNSVASNYNEPQTVLDVPRKAPQNDVYNSLTVNPAYVLPGGAPVRILIEPEYTDGNQRVLDLALKAALKSGTQGAKLGDVVFSLTPRGDTHTPALSDLSASDLVEKLRQYVQSGHDPFVSLELARGLQLRVVTEICRVLGTLEGENGIRVEPPGEEEIYYQAFASNEEFRSRSKRPGDAWELHIRVAGPGSSRLTAKLVEIHLGWDDDTGAIAATSKDIPLSSPDRLPGALSQHGPGLPVILVFADEAVSYGQLLSYLTPQVRATHGTIHVYLGDIRK